jgi:hypothetical protein
MFGKYVSCGLLLFVAGCSSENRPPTTAPTPTPTTTSVPRQSGPYTLSGSVWSEAGAPLAGAGVYIGSDARSPSFVSVRTDVQGRYVMPGLFAGTSRVNVSKPGYLALSEDVTIAEGAVKDFTLRPGVFINGRTVEAGVGPLSGVTITVISGPNAGVQTTSGGPLGGFSLPGPLPHGDFTIRASKTGYDTVDRAVHAEVDTYVDITMKWAYGSCLSSVTPVVFDRVAAAGATAVVAVATQGTRAWTATPNVPWIDVVSNATASGSAVMQFRVDPNPIGALTVRSGVIEIRCSETEGQNIWVTQLVDCQTTIEPTAATRRGFPAEGGIGRLLVGFGVRGCQSRDYSDVDWMFLAGVPSYLSGEVNFGVLRNTTGVPRSGSIVVGEARWTVQQDR